MSTQKGNSSRSRPQKYQNRSAFKNNLYDKSNKTKLINKIEVVNVCERCKKIIEWKIKYKKYKPLKTLSKCIKCEQKTINNAYHKICLPCANQFEVCPKCGEKGNIVEGKSSKEALKLDAELQNILKGLSERRRRTFIRYMNQQAAKHKDGFEKNKSKKNQSEEQEEEEEQEQEQEKIETCTGTYRENLLLKLKSLAIIDDDDNNSSDYDDNSDL